MRAATRSPGVTLQQAAADIDVIAHRLAQQYPKNYPPQFTLRVISWVDNVAGQFRTTLYTLAAAVGLLLCADVLRMIVRMGLRLVAIGVAIGLVGSFGVTRVIASQLFGISPYDPATIAGVIAVIGVAGVSACYVPARKALKVDPIIALRYE